MLDSYYTWCYILTQFCRNCGSKASIDSVFCEQCGAKLPSVSSQISSAKKYFPSKESHQRLDSPPQFYSSPQRVSSSRKPFIFGFIAVIIIVVLSGALFTSLILNETSYEYLGSTFDVFDRRDHPEMREVEFIIDNSVGTIVVDFGENESDTLVMTELEVYGPSSKSINDSNVFEVQVIGNRTLFLFNSYNPYTGDNLKYDIFIRVSTLLQASFDVQVITGEILFQAEGKNTIEEVSLETTTGSISASFINTFFPYESTINKIKTVTGSIDVHFMDILSEGDLYWNIEVVTGNIFTNHNQFLTYSQNTMYFLDLFVITGDIDYHFKYNETENIGYYFDSKIVTGQTTISGFSSSIDLPYFSPNFDLATLKIISTLETTTGSVTIHKN